MKSLSRKDIAEFVGIVAIVASLVFVGLELSQAQRVAIAEGWASNFATRIEIANSIKEDMVIWKKGTRGDELEEEESAIFAILLNELNDNNFQGYLLTRLIEGPIAAEFNANEFARFLYHAPGARKVWVERTEYIENNRRLLNDNHSIEPWHESIRTALLKLDRIKLPIDEKAFVYW